MNEKKRVIILGETGEVEVSGILRSFGCRVRCADRTVKLPNGEWSFLEVKNKDPFEPPPYYGQGIESYEYDMYNEIFQRFGMRCVLVVRGLVVRGTRKEWLVQFLDNLKGEKKYFKGGVQGGFTQFFNLNQFVPLHSFLSSLPKK